MPYALNARAAVVAAHAARIALQQNGEKGQQKLFVVRAASTADEEVVRGRWQTDTSLKS